MTRSDAAFDQFVGSLGPGVRATVERLADAITGADTRLGTAIKWGRLTFALGGDFHHWICGISAARQGATVQFHFGGLLPDPDGRLIAGSSRFLRRLDFASADSVDTELVAGFVRSAVDRLPFFKAHWKEIQSGTLEPDGDGSDRAPASDRQAGD